MKTTQKGLFMADKGLSIKDIMKKAYKSKILIPAFNVGYLPIIKPIVETLKENRTFGLVEVSRIDIKNFGAESFRAVAEEFNRFADRRYVRLHQDHIPVIDEDGKLVDWERLIKEAVRLNYDSVMIDGSRLPLEENIRITSIVVQICHPAGIPVEGEVGTVFGYEKGPSLPYEKLYRSGQGFTSMDDAKRFAKETSVDWLSVAIGSIHGAISGVNKDRKRVKAKLNIKHLQNISEYLKIPLVLHGGTGVRLEYLLEAIQNGITKINVGAALRRAYKKNLKNGLESAQEAVADEVRKHIIDYQIQGSAKKLSA